MNNVFELMGKFMLDTKDAEKGMNEVTGKAEKTGSKIGGIFKKLAVVIGGAFAIKKMVDFGVKAIKVTANLKAMESQFEQVFGPDKSAMMETINGLSDTMNIHVDRLTGTASKFGAQFKGAGMDAVTSMEATEKALMLSADASAFFDRSLDDISGAMASFMKGNFEAGDSLGVFTNAKQMDVRANEKYGKSWQDLAENERQWLLLDTVEKTYQMNGAIGQAVRESGAWENTTANLKATWERFLTIIGSPLLDGALKVITKITEGIGWLTEKLKLVDWSAMGLGGGLMDTISTKVGIVVGFIRDNWPQIQTIFSNVFNFVKSVWDGVAGPVFGLIKSVANDIIAFFIANWPKISYLVNDAFKFIQSVWTTTLKPTFDAVISLVKVVWDIFKLSFPLIMIIVKNAWETIKALWFNVGKPVFDKVGEIIRWLVAEFEKRMPVIEQRFKIMGQALQNVYNNIIRPAIDFIGAYVQKLVEYWNTRIGPLVTRIIGWFQTIASTITNKVNEAQAKVDNAVAKITGFFNKLNEAKATVQRIFSDIYNSVKDKIESARDKVKGAIDKIKSFFNFTWKLPALKLPKLSISGKFSLVPPQVPKFAITWNKLGAIFTKPTIFDTRHGFQGVGESGAEAILPISNLVPIMADALKMLKVGNDSELSEMVLLLREIKNKQWGTYLDGKELTRGIYKYIDETLARKTREYELERGGAF